MSQYADLPGTSGNVPSSPNDASMQLVGDLDLWCRHRPNTVWGTGQYLFTMYGPAGGYGISVISNTLTLLLGAPGANFINSDTNINTLLGNSQEGWVRIRYDQDTGSGNYGCQFYYLAGSTINPDPSDFTKIGATITGTSVVQGASTNAPVVGGLTTTSNLRAGRYMEVRVYDGFADAGGTLVYNPNFTCSGPARKGQGSFVDPVSGLTVTMNGTAAITGGCGRYKGPISMIDGFL